MFLLILTASPPVGIDTNKWIKRKTFQEDHKMHVCFKTAAGWSETGSETRRGK